MGACHFLFSFQYSNEARRYFDNSEILHPDTGSYMRRKSPDDPQPQLRADIRRLVYMVTAGFENSVAAPCGSGPEGLCRICGRAKRQTQAVNGKQRRESLTRCPFCLLTTHDSCGSTLARGSEWLSLRDDDELLSLVASENLQLPSILRQAAPCALCGTVLLGILDGDVDDVDGDDGEGGGEETDGLDRLEPLPDGP